jgi:predicted nucleotide-binding protein
MNEKVTNDIIWTEDDEAQINNAVEILRDHGLHVIVFTHPTRFCEYIAKNPYNCSLVIVDIVMPGITYFETIENGEKERVSTVRGYDTGLVLARWIKRHYPKISVVGVSAIEDPMIHNWFSTFGDGLFSKWDASLGGCFLAQVKKLAGLKQSPIKSFIVHGHDSDLTKDFKNFLKKFPEFDNPIVLREQPNLGRTIIEKFEALAENIEFVFVLMTPDDPMELCSATNNGKMRARQNVIFELGYFFFKFQRKCNRVFLLYKNGVELPSDISGLIYIDISDGIEQAGDLIRNEILAALSTKQKKSIQQLIK